MRDTALFRLIRNSLLTALEGRGMPTDTEVAQNYQQTQQGKRSAPTVYIHKLFHHRYGWQKNAAKFNPLSLRMERETMQTVETTYQINTTKDYVERDLCTVGDMAEIVAETMSSPEFMQLMRAGGARILRISEVRNDMIVNAQGHNQPVPSFDVVVTHENKFSKVVPGIRKFAADVKRV